MVNSTRGNSSVYIFSSEDELDYLDYRWIVFFLRCDTRFVFRVGDQTLINLEAVDSVLFYLLPFGYMLYSLSGI